MNGTTKKATRGKAVGKEKNAKPVIEVEPKKGVKPKTESSLKSKRKKIVPIISTSSSGSDSGDESSNSTVKYTFSQAPFSGMFASTQSARRGPKVDTATLLETYKDHKSLFQKDEPQSSSSSCTQNGMYNPKSKSKSKKASTAKSSSATSESVPSTLTVGFNYDPPSSSNAPPAQMYPLDMPVSEGQMAVADLPTDTELEVEEIPVNKSKKLKKILPKNGIKRQGGRGKTAIIIPEQVSSSSFEDTTDTLNDFKAFMQDLDEDDKESSPSPPKIRIAQDNLYDDVIELDALPSPAVASLSAQDYLNEIGQMRVRIQFSGQEYKFLGNDRWDMETVRHKLSELAEVPENELLIYTNTKDSQKMVDGKTLSYYKIEGGDVLEAMRRTVEKPTFSPAKHYVEKIKLKFQKAGLKKPIILDVSKFSSLKDIRSILALQLPDVDDKQLYFHFDGENIDLVQTPEELDLEDNDCIDVFVKSL